MRTDKRIREAMEAGTRNQETAVLVRNWCANVRIEKSGGVGLVEAQTGLPIGHHSLACDHAGGGAMATWDLRDAALDFHDRYCVDCKLRKPSGFPSLSKLVAERDQRHVEAERERSRASAEAEDALHKRQAVRAALQAKLPPLSSAIIEHIGDLDLNRTEENRARVVESAQLAARHFTDDVVSYVVVLTETEYWFQETGLLVLDAVNADPVRIARLAISALARSSSMRVAARILERHAAHIEPERLAPALPAIMHIANPGHSSFAMVEPPPAEPALLRSLYRTHREAVDVTIEALISSYTDTRIDLAARSISAIGVEDPSIFKTHRRTMVATFVRAASLVHDFDEYHRGVHDLQSAIIAAFFQFPDEIDQLISEYLQGATDDQMQRAMTLYERFMSVDRRFDAAPVDANSKPHRIAFSRVLWAATTLTTAEPLRVVASAFHGKPDHLVEIARAEIDGLIGAMLLMDQRVQQHEDSQPTEPQDFLHHLESANKRETLAGLAASFAKWAAIAAKSDPLLRRKLIACFDHIPEGREGLRGRFLKQLAEFGDTVDGFHLILPFLYQNLVCASPLLRAYAAETIAELPSTAHRNLPPLVYEAFSVLLYDPYVIVHQAAIHALRQFALPQELMRNATRAVLTVIRAYESNQKEARFLIDAISWLAAELKRSGNADKNVARFLVSVLCKIEPETLRYEIRWCARSLSGTYGFVDVVMRILPFVDGRDNDDEIDLLDRIPPEEVLRRKSELCAIGVQLATDQMWITARIVETLTRAAAWHDARQLLEDAIAAVPNTVQMRMRRMTLQSLLISARLEESIADGAVGNAAALDKEWQDFQGSKAEFIQDAQERRSRTGFPGSL
ncbi:MAG: hypothetical protein HZB28_10610 [Methylocystis sp.]|nr:hypothetical protein [Methylocystis sp.]